MNSVQSHHFRVTNLLHGIPYRWYDNRCKKIKRCYWLNAGHQYLQIQRFGAGFSFKGSLQRTSTARADDDNLADANFVPPLNCR
jgi:hypothetical protein